MLLGVGQRRFIVVDPQLVRIAEADGKPVAFALGLPDMNYAIKHANGRLFPFGWFRLIRKKSEMKRVRLVSTNVLPEFQLMGMGLVLERV